MASPFSFVRNVLGRGDPNSPHLNKAGNSIEIAEPRVISVQEAHDGFYCAIFDLLPGAALSSSVLSVPQKLVIDLVRNSLSERDFCVKAVPRLPTVIPKLLRSLRDPDASPRDYVSIVKKDPAMSAAVLKMANSVYFNAASNPVASIEVAVVKLGINGMRSVLSAAVMQPLVQRKSAYFSQLGNKLWQHTLMCAIVCEGIATLRGLDPFIAYLLGLTHEMGKITLFSELCKQFQSNAAGEKLSAAVFIPLMREKADALSATIATEWNLPAQIVSALQQQIGLKPGAKVDAYGQLLYQANLACEAYLIQHLHPEFEIDLERLAEQLSFPAAIFEELSQVSIDF